MSSFTHRNPNGPRKQRGQSLTEWVIYVALAAIVLAAIFVYFNRSRHEQQANSAASNLIAMDVAVVKQWGQDPNGFANVTAAAIVNNGDAPSAMIQGGNLVSDFGTPITVAPATTYNANDSIAYSTLVPVADCSNLVQAVAKSFTTITVAGTAVKNVAGGVPTISNTTLGTQCASTNGAQVPVVFTATR